MYTVNLCVMLVIYGYFGFGIADDGTTCLASTDDNGPNHRFEDEPDKGDFAYMGENFRFGFTILFCTTVFQALLLLAIYIYDLLENMSFLIFVVMATVFVNFSTWLVLWMIRKTHEGMVCSGDYLKAGAD